jgi:hypothetical protein
LFLPENHACLEFIARYSFEADNDGEYWYVRCFIQFDDLC